MQALLAAMTPEIHQQLKTAVELGHWENGVKLTDEQREHCIQVVIAYDSTYLNPEQRIGYINRKGKSSGE